MAAFPASIWNGKIEKPGLYLGVPEDVYHADPCPQPSLSSHVARIILKRSLKHAKAKHPRLADPDLSEDDDDENTAAPASHLLIGQGAHSLMLGVGKPVIDCETNEFRTNEAKARRDLILENGGIPLRTKHYRAAKRMAELARPVFKELLGGEFIPEAMLAWEENGFWRRGLLDGVNPNMRIAGDYKTSGRACPPPFAAQFANANGYPFQEGFYRHGFDALDPEGRGRRKFYFLFQEVEYPHAMAVVETDEANRTLADDQTDAACALWDRAMHTGQWPSYPLTPYTASPKPWDLAEWEDRMMMDETLNPNTLESM